MILDFVIKQLTGSRPVKNGIRYKDKFSADYLYFRRLVRRIERDNLAVSKTDRERIAAILKNNRRAVTFRLMSRAERKAAGCGPRMVAETSAELKKLITRIEKAGIKKPAERKKEIDERARTNRAAMRLGH